VIPTLLWKKEVFRPYARCIVIQNVKRLIIVLLIVSVLLFVTATLWLPMVGSWLAQPSHVGRADAIVVLGGGSLRTLLGITLYKQKVAPELWNTGDVPGSASPAELIIQQGVPAEVTHILPSTSTWEDAQAIADLARRRKVQSIVVVTDWYHSRRALCSIRHHLAGSGIKISYDFPPSESYRPDNWWQSQSGRNQVLSELGKIMSYWLRYGLNPWRC
jgi:uncharacterized SAM-binding protein YcdF (DUF218 family)